MLENKEILEGSEVCLMDIDPARLPTLTKLAETLSRRAKAELEFSRTTDPKEALEGATFVLPTYRIGGERHMRFDYTIPTKYGICGDETTGPGGTFMAQCTIPATLDYCRLIQDLCPDAWVISYVNPTNFVADAVRRETRVKFIAICDCFASFAMRFLPFALDMPPLERRYTTNNDIRPRAIGINHCTWLTDLYVNGKDGYQLLKERVKSKLEEHPETEIPELADELDFSMRHLDAYNYFNVCPTHCRMLWDHDDVLEKRKSISMEQKMPASVLGFTESSWEFINAMLAGADYDPHRPEYCFRLHHSRHIIGIMASIMTDEGREWGGINFPNKGAITNLPQDAMVEGPCIVDKRGVTPIAVGDLPKCFLGVTLHLLNWEQLTVDAALSGDKKLLYQALLACPYVHDMKAAKAIMEELLQAHAEYMPQFRKRQLASEASS
jgi:alpha-galactosidase/6-phospho-beta-glucosidase family protein